MAEHCLRVSGAATEKEKPGVKNSGTSTNKLALMGNIPGWPFGCFTKVTTSGQKACIPGGKYGNIFLFRSLCPDAIPVVGRCSECACREKLQIHQPFWRPPTLRLLSLATFLGLTWCTIFYGVYSLLPSTQLGNMNKASKESTLRELPSRNPGDFVNLTPV